MRATDAHGTDERLDFHLQRLAVFLDLQLCREHAGPNSMKISASIKSEVWSSVLPEFPDSSASCE